MKFSTTEEMAEWYRQDTGKEPPAKSLELAKCFVWLCKGLEELGKTDAANGKKPLSISVFRKLMEDAIHGEGDFAKQFRLEWSDTAHVSYMRGYNG